MADYLSTNTPRLRITQTGPRGTHKMTFRVQAGIGAAAAIAAVNPILEEMKKFTFETTAFSGAEFAVIDSDVFLPVAFTPIVNFPAAAVEDNTQPYGCYVNFLGRSAAGSRVAFYLFNVPMQYITKNNRISLAEFAILGTTLAAFATASASLAAIDQATFVMKPYANSGINDKVAKKSRALV